MGKRLLIFGPPGAGKGTHAARLASDLGIPYLATGDMLRAAIASGSAAGREAEKYIRLGELVPDHVVIALLEERLTLPDAADGFLLDGFPRTVAQAERLARRLASRGEHLDGVVALEADEDVLVARLSGRFICPRCGRTYNRLLRPPRAEGVCDACGASLTQRPDDTVAAVRHRLREHRAKTEALMAFFRSVGWPVRSVPSVGEVDEVYGRIRKVAEA